MNMKSGLSSNGVNAILKDRDGWIWIGTNHGIDLFDGETVRASLNQQTFPGMPNNRIEYLGQDKTGMIWAGFISGYFRFDPIKGICLPDNEAYFKQLNFNPLHNYQLEIDDKGDLWVYDSLQVYHYDYEAQRLHTYNINNVCDIYVIKDRAIIVCDDLSVCLLNCLTDEIVIDECLKLDAYGQTMKRHIAFLDSHDYVWIYNKYHNKLYAKKIAESRWEEIKGDEKDGLPNLDVRNFAERSDGTVIVSMGRYGFYQWDPYEKKFHHFEENKTQSQSVVSNIFVDEDDVVWVGYETNGLAYILPAFNRFDYVCPSKMVNSELISHSDRADDVTRIFEDKYNNLWVGTNGNGLTMFPIDETSPWHFDVDGQDVVVCLAQDTLDRIWVGTYGEGIYWLDAERHCLRHISEGELGLTSSDIWSFSLDDKGAMWIGTLNDGFQRWNELDQVFEAPSVKQSTHCIVPGFSTHSVLMGTAFGLFEVDVITNQYKHYLNNNEGKLFLPDPWIKTMLHDSQSRLWAGFINGLACYDSKMKQIASYGLEQGMKSEVVPDIVEDSLHQIWITTEQGILRMNDEKLESYTTLEGLPFDGFNMRSMLCRRDGRILAGGPTGVVVFDPRNIGSEQEWRQRVFPNINKNVSFVNDKSNTITFILVLTILFILFFIIWGIYMFYNARLKKKYSYKPIGVQVDPVTGIVSIDELTVEKLKNVVEANIGNADFTIEQLAREMGMSRGQLHKRVVALTGYAPLEYLRRYRLERAKQYLLESQMTISEIAYIVGFNSPKLFSKYFKSVYGKIPSEIKPK